MYIVRWAGSVCRLGSFKYQYLKQDCLVSCCYLLDYCLALIISSNFMIICLIPESTYLFFNYQPMLLCYDRPIYLAENYWLFSSLTWGKSGWMLLFQSLHRVAVRALFHRQLHRLAVARCVAIFFPLFFDFCTVPAQRPRVDPTQCLGQSVGCVQSVVRRAPAPLLA